MKLMHRSFVLVFIFISLMSYSQSKIRIACVGNSITFGATINNRESNSYPAQLAAMFGENYEVRNFGKNGATLLRKGNYPYRTCPEYTQAIEFQPDLVFIKKAPMTANLLIVLF